MFKRNFRHKADHVEPDLPIIPMLDMSFQLLAFFVTTFAPTAPEGHLDMALPKQSDGGWASLAPPDPTVEEPEELSLEIDTTDKGGVGAMRLKKDGLTLKEYPDQDALITDLVARAKTAAGKPAKVKLDVPEALRYSGLITLMDNIQRSGYKNVAPALSEPGKKK